MIDFAQTPDQLKLRADILDFAQQIPVGGDSPKTSFDRELWKAAGELKLQGLSVSPDFGGRGLDARSTLLALEALGYGSEDNGFNFAIAAHLLACVIPISMYGSKEQKERLLPGLCQGDLIASNAMTEPSSGSDVYDLHTTAILDQGDYILNGHKSYCSNGPVADIVLTYALTNKEKGFFGGISAFLLEKQKHAFKASAAIDKMGLHSCLMGEVVFDQLRVTEAALLDQAGGGAIIFNKSMEWERVCLGALHLGAMDRLMKKAVAFAKARKSGGQSISSYQAVAHPLAELKVRIEAARLLSYKAAWKLDQGKNVSLEAASCKWMVSETYKDLVVHLTQLYAGQAYRKEHGMERHLNDAMASTIYSGTSEIQKNIIARRMGLSS